ncbi:MAG TPA: hypothetical protein PKC91_13040 [Ignavibacteria bacterium]|jgi:hypothetical protein|nr:hypothetical protein [Ignavibacteria bacterium]
MANKVSVLDKDGVITDYSSYASARAAIIALSIQHPLIQIWANLSEPIELLNGADIWIAPGAELNNTTGATITDVSGGLSREIHCKIYGYGKIKNTGGYSCIFMDKINSELTIECDSFDTSTTNSVGINISQANKFHLSCKSILSKGPAIYIGTSGNIVENLRLNINKIETGDTSSTPIAGTSIVTYANGIIYINELICRNRGHCLLHRKGNLTANIKKITTKHISGNLILSAVALIQDNIGTQKLVLYFDEIKSIDSYCGIEIGQGEGVLLGRSVTSNVNSAIQIVGANTKGFLKCNKIISQNTTALVVNDFTNQITIDCDYIEGNGNGDYAAVYSYSTANFNLRNTKIINKNSDSASKAIILIANITTGAKPNATLNNIKLISNGELIYFNGNINIINFGLFGNKNINTSNVNLQVGTYNNKQFIYDPNLT